MEFEGYKYIAQFIVLIEVILILIFYRRNSKIVVYITLLSIFLKGQYIWLGKPIYAWYFSSYLSFIYLTGNRINSIKAPFSKSLNIFENAFLLYFIYTILISGVMWFVYSVEGAGTATTAVSASRIFTQIFYFLLIIGLYSFGKKSGTEVSTNNLIKAMVKIAVVVAYFAVFQVLVVKFTGINLFPIVGSDDLLHSAYIMDQSFRATSFAGEPKHLGMIMSIGLTMYFLSSVLCIPLGSRYKLHMPLIMLLALILSLSTTGIVMTSFGISIIGIVFFNKVSKLKVLSFIIVILTLLVMVGIDREFISSLESQVSKSGLEIQDQTVRLALFDNPIHLFTGTGLGNIHLLAVEYLPLDFPLFKDQGYKANSGILFVVADSGLIGLMLLVIAFFCIFEVFFQLRGKLNSEQYKESVVAVTLIFLSLVNFMLRYDVLFFFISGFVFSRFSLLHTTSLPFIPKNGFNSI